MSTAINIEDIVLSDDQQNALDAICDFVTDPEQAVFVLSGYAGTGKSTLVKKILDHLPKFLKTIQLVQPDYEKMDIELTATTNSACEALSHMSGEVVCTIHSLLGLRLHTDYKTGENTLVADKAKTVYNKLIFIDEASYIDKNLLRHIFDFTDGCKIIFMGDPAQLAPVKSADTPVFNMKYPGAKLEKIMRQADGNPIIDLATAFRHAVNTGVFPEDVNIDGTYIKHMGRDEFNEAVKAEFTRDDWRFADSKVLAWTNRRVIEYNHYIRELAKGDPNFEVEDYAVVNQYVQAGKISFKTDQMVRVTGMRPYEIFDTPGTMFELDEKAELFMPASLAIRTEAFKRAQAQENYNMVVNIKNQWLDLRAAYSCTINKSQGRTYDKAYIDLDDIGACRNKNTLARMLYVGFSRARHQLILTGDLK
jgi:ATP-dependent exoDNAse (exonuclease V) alpha subunit